MSHIFLLRWFLNMYRSPGYSFSQEVQLNSPILRHRLDWVPYWHLVKRMWEKWWYVTSETKSQEALWLPSCPFSAKFLLERLVPCWKVVKDAGPIQCRAYLARKGSFLPTAMWMDHFGSISPGSSHALDDCSSDQDLDCSRMTESKPQTLSKIASDFPNHTKSTI